MLGERVLVCRKGKLEGEYGGWSVVVRERRGWNGGCGRLFARYENSERSAVR